ncbi:MAG TPA: hypothetical protein VE821_10335, partial [Pyrinomonadaceae bacterium]|nr:hypothetical protein [Pyrinomonadaceae bacterium]
QQAAGRIGRSLKKTRKSRAKTAEIVFAPAWRVELMKLQLGIIPQRTRKISGAGERAKFSAAAR